MDDGTDWNDILSEPTPEASEPAAPQTEQSERARDPATGKFISASDPGDEHQEAAPQPPVEAAPPAAQQDADTGHIPVAALKDERQKRQQAEDQLRQYEAYFSSLQQPQQQYQQPVEIPDMYVDPAGYTAWVAEQVEARIMQQVQQYGGQFETNNLVRVSELMARQRHDDYDAVISGPFKEAIAVNPMLVEHMKQAPDPASFAYNAGKQYEQARQFGTNAPVDRAAVEAEIRQQIMSELGLSSQPKAPSSLASERSVAVSRSGPAWGGPTSWEDALR